MVVTSLHFAFPGSRLVIGDLNLVLPRGSRTLLCGANGAGKTTLLQVSGAPITPPPQEAAARG